MLKKQLIARNLYIIFFFCVLFIPYVLICHAYYSSYSILSKAISYQPPVSTKIYDRNDELVSELFEENRQIIAIKDVPDAVKQAFLSAEDQHFYVHGGIDFLGIMRAVIVNLASGDIRQGGSTITQQLVKQLYTKGEKNLHRKVVEMFLSFEFERRFSKNQILEMYLNQVYFGHGVYGIASAARFYFKKDIESLDLMESSLLAAIPTSPNKYSPLRNPKKAFERHKKIVFNIIESGYASKSEIIVKFNEFWVHYLHKIKTRYPTATIRAKRFDKAPHFTEHVRRILVERYGNETVYRKGLQVYTTIDLEQQKSAEYHLKQSIDEQNKIASMYNRNRVSLIDKIMLKNIEKSGLAAHVGPMLMRTLREDIIDELLAISLITGCEPIYTGSDSYIQFYNRLLQESKVEGAIVAIDVPSGAITALVGGSVFNAENQLNRATQSQRQPGSSFKAFVYGAGIESGKITAASQYIDAPLYFRGRHSSWSPSNYGNSYVGNVLVRRAFALSLNVIAVLVGEDIGYDRVANFAARVIGIPKKRFSIDPTLALGTTELSPLEMAKGFAVFASGGRNVAPFAIQAVKKFDGTLLEQNEPPKSQKQLMSRETSYIMTSLMREVVDNGTATGAIRGTARFHYPAAGKTGTNTNFRDAWFVGYTPDLVAAVWLGCDSQKYSLGFGQSAAAVAAPIWGKFMHDVYRSKRYGSFPPAPGGIVGMQICSHSGKVPITGCPVRMEIFRRGTEPVEECTGIHDDMKSIIDLVREQKDDGSGATRLKLEEGDSDEKR